MGKHDGAPEWTHVEAQRRRIAEVFESLTPEQLDAQSLCADWRVRDVLGHMVSPFLISVPKLLLGVVRHRGINRAMSVVARDLGNRSGDELVALMRENAAHRFVPPGGAPVFPLTDITIHALDAFRPIGVEDHSPPDVQRRVLDFIVSPLATRGFVPKRRFDGLEIEATDLGWTWGTGARLAGPAEDLLLAMTGRSSGFEALDGEGVSILRARI